MGWGFKGPITSPLFTQYAIARTYRILTDLRNRYSVHCKICDTTVEPDHGREIMVTTLQPSQLNPCYACAECFALIKPANEKFPSYPELPDWWRNLDRAPLSREELAEQAKQQKEIPTPEED